MKRDNVLEAVYLRKAAPRPERPSLLHRLITWITRSQRSTT